MKSPSIEGLCLITVTLVPALARPDDLQATFHCRACKPNNRLK